MQPNNLLHSPPPPPTPPPPHTPIRPPQQHNASILPSLPVPYVIPLRNKDLLSVCSLPLLSLRSSLCDTGLLRVCSLPLLSLRSPLCVTRAFYACVRSHCCPSGDPCERGGPRRAAVQGREGHSGRRLHLQGGRAEVRRGGCGAGRGCERRGSKRGQDTLRVYT